MFPVLPLVVKCYLLCAWLQADLEQNHVIPIYIFIAGYSVSIIMLLASLGIFFAFRSEYLPVFRIVLLKQA